MSLNIKNERTHALVRRLAELTGQSQTSAVEDAVARRLAELERSAPTDASRAEVARIVVEFQSDLTPRDRERIRRSDAELYDEHGLPR